MSISSILSAIVQSVFGNIDEIAPLASRNEVKQAGIIVLEDSLLPVNVDDNGIHRDECNAFRGQSISSVRSKRVGVMLHMVEIFLS